MLPGVGERLLEVPEIELLREESTLVELVPDDMEGRIVGAGSAASLGGRSSGVQPTPPGAATTRIELLWELSVCIVVID